MSRTNGIAKDEPQADWQEAGGHLAAAAVRTDSRMPAKKLRELVEALEVPFDPVAIEWRAIQTSKSNGQMRGKVIPYADQRAYTDRLNALFTPAGWTRRYAVHTSANFHRSKDEKIVAKVFVTCDLTIFGLGSHSATGEEWADDDNAGTSAEAQAFKRACSCFGLGRYLYHFSGVWVDVDERKRPKKTPVLFGWATPEGWKQGLRPQPQETVVPQQEVPANANPQVRGARNTESKPEQTELTRRIESMAQPLGKRLYRGVLKSVARAWQPSDITDTQILSKVLDRMQIADQMLNRMASVLQQTGPESLQQILRSLQVKSLEHVDSIETLEMILRALEAH